MTDRYDADDPAFDAQTGILRNKLGITDPGQLKNAEAAFVTERALQGLPKGNLDFDHLLTIHGHLFQDIYPWAGQTRTVQMTKHGSRFAAPAFIRQEADNLFASLESEGHLQGLALTAFAQRAAHYANELNAIHPFREGNGRAIRAFLTVLAEGAGFALHLQRITPVIWLQASIKGFQDSDDAMADLIKSAMTESTA